MASITRRDFLNGAALTIAAGLTPAAQLAAQPALYPPALTGLRGQHAGSFEVGACARRARAGSFRSTACRSRKRYDLVVVGGGISGLAAAWFYRRAKPSARILILDNHDDFGGHAKRNEFTLDGRRIIGYGGSQSLQSPNTLYSPVAKGLLRDLGVDLEALRDRVRARPLSVARAVARHVLQPRGVRPRRAGDRRPRWRRSRRRATPSRWRSSSPAFRSPTPSKAQIVALHAGTSIRWPENPRMKSARILKRTSYRDYLTKICGCSDEVANCFQGRPLGFFGLGSDAVPAADARDLGYPGFAGAEAAGRHQSGLEGAVHLSFPRRQRVDRAASGPRAHSRRRARQTMDDIVQAPFDYGTLDRSDQPVRIRLDSTCVHAAQSGDKAELGLCARRRVASRRGAARRARLLPHDDPLHRARTCRSRSTSR